MGLINKFSENTLYKLVIIALVLVILNFSGGIVNSIFEIGRTFGTAIGDLLFK